MVELLHKTFNNGQFYESAIQLTKDLPNCKVMAHAIHAKCSCD